jgi:PAS domain S-box-containing protein
MPRKMQLRKWPWGRPGIRAKLILSFLAALLPALLMLAVMDQREYLQRERALADDCRAVAQAAAASAQARIDEAAAGLSAAAALGPAEAAAALEALRKEHPEYLDLFLLDGQGQVLACVPSGQAPQVIPDSVAQAASAGAPVLSDLFFAASGDVPALQVLVPLRPGAAPAAAGVTVDAQALSGLLAGDAAGAPYQVVLCDRQGWAVGGALATDTPWPARDWSRFAHIRLALQGQAATAPGVADPLDGRLYGSAAVPLGATGWAVEARLPMSGPAGYLGRLAGSLLPLTVLVGLAVALAVAVANWFTVPVRRLAAYARGLGRGQLNERVAMNTGDEFEDLAAALNQMARQMEERDRRLRARTAELDAIITQSADGIAIHGPSGELQRLNPAGIRIMGRPTVRLGLSLAEQAAWFKIRTVAGEPVDPNDLPVSAALRGETRVGQELRIETETGQDRYVAFSASPLYDAHGHIYGAVSTFRDMTGARQAQQEKDNFISIVSHELKTPITSIKGYAQMLLRRAEEAGSDERDLKGLRIINDEVERMVDLINQLLDVQRLEMQRLQLNLDRVDLVSLTLDTVDRLQMTTSRHTLQPRVPEGPVWVYGDAVRLAQVLGNLIMNAIKYSPAGGPVEVSLERQEGRAWVSVRDWGIGIAPEDQPHLFQRFWRGTRKENTSLTGMGLGLYISREIVRRHHGDIVFRSQPGQGSTFLFWLPLDEGKP